MKKIIYGMGSLTLITVPVIAAVSCGGTNSDNATTKQVVATQEPTGVSTTPQADVSSAKVFTEPFKINDQVVPVTEDGIYLSRADYHDGVIWNGKTIAAGEAVNDDIVKLGDGGMSLDNALMLGDNDSVYVLYDQDNNDHMTPDTFKSNLYFVDTSIASMTVDENVKIGNLRGSGWGGNLIPFISSVDGYTGALNKYFGSQSNHMTAGAGYADDATFKASILKIKASLEHSYPESLQKILNYYGVMVNAQGQVVPDPAHPAVASQAFAPVFSEKPIFTYERVATNAYKVTYHYDGNSRITAAHFAFNASDNSVKGEYGSLSLGDKQEWDSYMRHDDARYQAIKNAELQPYLAAHPKVVAAPSATDIPYDTWKHKVGFEGQNYWPGKFINGEAIVSATVRGSFEVLETATYKYELAWKMSGTSPLIKIWDGLTSKRITKADNAQTPITDMSDIHITTAATPLVDIPQPVAAPTSGAAIAFDQWKTHGRDDRDARTYWTTKQINGEDVTAFSISISGVELTTATHHYVLAMDIISGQITIENSQMDGNPITGASQVVVTVK